MDATIFVQDFKQLTPYLKGFAMQLTKDDHHAEDLFQETALLAYKHRHSFSSNTNFKAWLGTIMKNTFINQLRKKKRQAEVFDYTPENYLINSGSQPVHNDAPGKLTLEELEKLLAQLPEELKKPFELAFKGYKYEEISTLTGLPLGTVKSRIFFARKRLQEKVLVSFPYFQGMDLAA